MIREPWYSEEVPIWTVEDLPFSEHDEVKLQLGELETDGTYPDDLAIHPAREMVVGLDTEEDRKRSV